MFRRFPLSLALLALLGASRPTIADDTDTMARLKERGMRITRFGSTIVAVQGFGAKDGDIKYIKRLTTLKRLDLTNSELTDAGLAELADLKGLEEIQLYASTKIHGDGIKHLLGNKNLHTLHLDISHINNNALIALRDAGKLYTLYQAARGNTRPTSDANIRTLELGWDVTDPGLASLVGLPALECLYLSGRYVTDRTMPIFGKMTKLRELSIRGAQVTDAGLKELLPIKNLEVLHIDDAPITDEGLKTLAEFKSLRMLILNSPKIKGEGFHHLSGGPLRELFMCRKLNDDYIRELRKAKLLHTLHEAYSNSNHPPKSDEHVRYFDLSYAKITAASLKELASLPSLVSISLNGTPIKGEDFVNMKDATKLNTIAFDTGTISDEALRVLKKNDMLHVLAGAGRLAGHPQKLISAMHFPYEPITDEGLKELRDIATLKELNLSHTKVSDASAAVIRDLPALETLIVRETGMTNKSLSKFLKSKSLKEVTMPDKHINDETLKLLHEKDRLVLLTHIRTQFGKPRTADNVIGAVFVNTQVTDEGLKVLHAYPNLKFVTLRQSKVTDKGVADLLRVFPKLKVNRHSSHDSDDDE